MVAILSIQPLEVVAVEVKGYRAVNLDAKGYLCNLTSFCIFNLLLLGLINFCLILEVGLHISIGLCSVSDGGCMMLVPVDMPAYPASPV